MSQQDHYTQDELDEIVHAVIFLVKREMVLDIHFETHSAVEIAQSLGFKMRTA